MFGNTDAGVGNHKLYAIGSARFNSEGYLAIFGEFYGVTKEV